RAGSPAQACSRKAARSGAGFSRASWKSVSSFMRVLRAGSTPVRFPLGELAQVLLGGQRAWLCGPGVLAAAAAVAGAAGQDPYEQQADRGLHGCPLGRVGLREKTVGKPSGPAVGARSPDRAPWADRRSPVCPAVGARSPDRASWADRRSPVCRRGDLRSSAAARPAPPPPTPT